MTTIKSWAQKEVRIKEEYIVKVKEIDEELSTYDDDGNIIKEVLEEYEYINTQNGMRSVFSGYERAIFKVVVDCYGVDLRDFRANKTNIEDLPKPTHQIMVARKMKSSTPLIEEYDYYDFLWDSKYFEVVTTETIYVADKEFNN